METLPPSYIQLEICCRFPFWPFSCLCYYYNCCKYNTCTTSPSYGFAKVPTATYGYQAPSPAQTPALDGYAQPQLPDQGLMGGYSNSPSMAPVSSSPGPAPSS
jgi:hypothetical protein